jgi:amino-acid N-acetyltransferase
LHSFAASVELACLAAHPGQKHSRAPVGDQLLAAAEQHGRKLGAEKLFVLTTSTQDWFIERGFIQSNIDELPEDRKASYDETRGSQVLAKELG